LRILVELDGVVCPGELLPNDTTRAFHAILPWQAMAVHDAWSGHVLYAPRPCPLPPPARVSLGTAKTNIFAGEIAYYSPWQRVLLGYDFGQFRIGAAGAQAIQLLGRLDSTDPAFAELAAHARAMQAGGQRPLSIRRG
jgi:hypothetical protein